MRASSRLRAEVCVNVLDGEPVGALDAHLGELEAAAARDLVGDGHVTVGQLVRVQKLAGVELGAERVGRGRERRGDGAAGRDLVEEVALRLEAVADAALALDDGGVVDGALALDGEEFAPALLAQLVALDADHDLRPDAPPERDRDAVVGRVEADPDSSKRGQSAGV